MLKQNESLEAVNLRDNQVKNSAGLEFLEACRKHANIQFLNLSGNLIDPKNLLEIDDCLKRNHARMNQDLVPTLKAKIQALILDPDRESAVQCKIQRVAKLKERMEVRVNEQALKLEDVRAIEEGKTEELKEERLGVREQFIEVSKSFSDLQESLKVMGVQHQRGIQEMLDKIAVVTNELKVKEKKKAALKQQVDLKKIQNYSVVDEVKDTLAKQELALRSMQNGYQRATQRLQAVRQELRQRTRSASRKPTIEAIYLASTKLANVKRDQARKNSFKG